MRQITLHIDGMSCNHCLNAVTRALSAVPGVELESVRIGGASVRYDEAQADPERIISAVREAGYEARA